MYFWCLQKIFFLTIAHGTNPTGMTLPTDPFYKAVQIKVPRAINRRPRKQENLNEGFHEDYID